METIITQLKALPEEIKVGITGIGSMGKGLAFQCHITPGFRPAAISNRNLAKAEGCAKWLGVTYEIVDTVSELNSAIARKVLAVCDDCSLVCSSEEIDVLIESTNDPLAGAKHALKAIEYNQHIVMMNHEAEVMYGPLIMKKAEEKGLIYTVADGDQPASMKILIDDLAFYGFDLVMAGNIKGYLDRYTNPAKIAPEADKRSLDHKMTSSFTDGSKLCVEMSVIANALDLRTPVPGMYGHRMDHINDIFKHYDFDSLYEDKKPVVDYILGAQPKGGVFAVGYTDKEYQQFTLDWFPVDMGSGPYYLFYRPYHLRHIEALKCVAEAILYGNSRLKPKYGIKTNVFCYAKENLKQGDKIDGAGGFACYGLIENLEDFGEDGVPICIAEDVVLKKDYKKDERILMKDVDFQSQSEAFELYFETLKIKGDIKMEYPFASQEVLY
ncbi:Homoserine dehydrogenase [Fulvivirga imtechensis AK7]|uniref:Homoserine dehydrogenase n=1 Tax=Fulvivirga imtechensis AK7 TaxID=1237149 RepID=L8JVI8_9BACT|nr:homoserine dehydrogenase [Fulvivirga imtechensis]ELR72800.1 Homoserine dehydrogenase [Fulvivirga imtechensis AK7]